MKNLFEVAAAVIDKYKKTVRSKRKIQSKELSREMEKLRRQVEMYENQIKAFQDHADVQNEKSAAFSIMNREKEFGCAGGGPRTHMAVKPPEC